MRKFQIRCDRWFEWMMDLEVKRTGDAMKMLTEVVGGRKQRLRDGTTAKISIMRINYSKAHESR